MKQYLLISILFLSNIAYSQRYEDYIFKTQLFLENANLREREMALNHIDKAIKKCSSKPEKYVLLNCKGHILYDLGKFDKAYSSLQTSYNSLIKTKNPEDSGITANIVTAQKKIQEITIMQHSYLSIPEIDDSYIFEIDYTNLGSNLFKIYYADFLRNGLYYNEAIEQYSENTNLSNENCSETEKEWYKMISRESQISIADCYRELGEYSKALDICQEFETKKGETPQVEYIKGLIYNDLGNKTKAIDILNRCKQGLEESGEIHNLTYCNINSLLGSIYLELKDYKTSLDYSTVAAESFKSLFNTTNNKGYVSNLTNIMCVKMMQDNEEEAEKIRNEIEDIIDNNDKLILEEQDMVVAEIKMELLNKKIFSDHSVNIQLLENGQDIINDYNYSNIKKAEYINLLGNLYHRIEDYGNAIKIYTGQLNEERKLVKQLFSFLPEEQREKYWKERYKILSNIFLLNKEGCITIGNEVLESSKMNKNRVSEILYNAVLVNKGMLLEAQKNLQRIIYSTDNEELIKNYEKLRKVRIKASNPAIKPTERLLYEETADKIEKYVISLSSEYEDYMNFTDIDWIDIKNSLKENEAAIEFVASTDDNYTYYSAEILKNHSEKPTHVFLCGIKKGSNIFKDESIYSNRVLYQKIWKKILPHIKQNDRVYFSPDGELYNVGIEYALINDSTRIGDYLDLRRVSSTRILVQKKKYNNKNSAALYGGLDYDIDTEEMEYYAETSNERSTYLSASEYMDGSNITWNYLKGTEKEVNNIEDILKNADYSTICYSGGYGVEENFKKLSGEKIKIIHIATHGYYLPNITNNQYNTGLIFSGANNFGKTSKNIDDGILTAQEITNMDLIGADLVVMSACQTGLGDITSEGVFGLQRGFKKAGAETLVMSLWSVNDTATEVMMSNFYKKYTEGFSKYDAFKYAQECVKKGKYYNREGELKSGSDPHFWASFIMLD